MFDRFIDKVRMTTAEAKNRKPKQSEIAMKIKPHISYTASKGESHKDFIPVEGVITVATWVENNWEYVKSYFEDEGFKCEKQGNVYRISWD